MADEHVQNLQGMQGLNLESGGELGPQEDSWYMDERIKRLLLDLQRHWLMDYQNSRERVLVEITERVSSLFLDCFLN